MTTKGDRSLTARKRAYRMGLGAEFVCALYFSVLGYRILERRYKTHAGEVDLVLRRGAQLVFVEVKYRADPAEALFAVGERQKQRVARAAGLFIANHPHLAAFDQRFDLFVWSPWTFPRHIANAWEAPQSA